MGRRAIKIIKLQGLTIENKMVFSGLYKFQNTHGVSLFEILDYMKFSGHIISWKNYIIEALEFGKKKEALVTDILTSVLDSSYINNEEFDYFKQRLERLMEIIQNDTTIPE